MTEPEQRQRIDSSREAGIKLFWTELSDWTTQIINGWTPGSTAVPGGKAALQKRLRPIYDKVVNRTVGTDYTRYKQDDDPDPFEQAMEALTAAILIAIAARLAESVTSIIDTLQEQMKRASAAAEAADVTAASERIIIGRTALTVSMRNHRIIIAVSESNWTVNTAFRTAILSVNDPLNDSIGMIVELLRNGDGKAARRLARDVLRLLRLPTSVSQGELLAYLNDIRDELVTPGVQARIIASLEDQAEKLGSQFKRWEAIFVNTRPSHAAAHGQEQSIDEPFVLEGGRLQYPMDGSLGASLGEIINCQCRHVYV